MLLDILLIFTVLFATLFGLRDGLVRKAVALGVMVVAMILGSTYRFEAGKFLVENAGVDPASSATNGFLLIFFTAMLVQSLAYRIVTGAYKIGGIADRVGGGIVGFMQGILFASVIMMVFAVSGFPSRETRRESRLYQSVVNIAPQIVDFAVTAGPESVEKLKEITTPGTGVTPDEVKKRMRSLSDSSSSSEARRQQKMLQDLRKSARGQQ